MNEDPYGLTNDEIPLNKRREAFNRALDDFGAKDPHMLSFSLKVTPQVVIAFYELNNVSKEELEFLTNKKLDMGLISVLMNIDPVNRKRIYGDLESFLRDKHPVRKIIEFLNKGAGLMTIEALYDAVEPKYWMGVAGYLKDMEIASGTINKQFRGMLVNIAKYKASEDQLDWLERALFHDQTGALGVFTAPTLLEKYPKSVEAVRKFLDENKVRYERAS